MRLAYAVVHDDPPRVFAAQDLDVLHRVLAMEVVAATPTAALPAGAAPSIREALLDERWGDAVTMWIGCSGLAIDVYDDLVVWTDDELEADFTGVRLQFTPLFEDG